MGQSLKLYLDAKYECFYPCRNEHIHTHTHTHTHKCMLPFPPNSPLSCSPFLPHVPFCSVARFSCVKSRIYPRSFQDSNGDGTGDLKGIEQRLPYLKALSRGSNGSDGSERSADDRSKAAMVGGMVGLWAVIFVLSYPDRSDR